MNTHELVRIQFRLNAPKIFTNEVCFVAFVQCQVITLGLHPIHIAKLDTYQFTAHFEGGAGKIFGRKYARSTYLPIPQKILSELGVGKADQGYYAKGNKRPVMFKFMAEGQLEWPAFGYKEPIG